MASRLSPFRLLFLIAALVLFGGHAWAGTKVRIATPLGNIDLELYDTDRPITVQNFLGYVSRGDYAHSFSHRLVPNFVIQGGGYYIKTAGGNNTVTPVSAQPAIKNEFNGDPKFSNVKGTITMAKLDGNVDSATSQWFINLKDNNTGNATEGNLDLQNGGFTVFGRVLAGMNVLNALNATFVNGATGGRGIYDATTAIGADFGSLPLIRDNNLTIDNLLSTTISVLPAPDVRITGKSIMRVKAAKTALRGTASRGVDQLEWKLGPRGSVHRVTGRTDWTLQVTGLKRGRNVVYVRGTANVGGTSPFRSVQIVRK